MLIKKLWAKIFRKSVKYSSDETTIGITHNIYNLAKKGRINIYNGTISGLREAQSSFNSTIMIIEITHPVDKNLRIKFREYVAKLRENFNAK